MSLACNTVDSHRRLSRDCEVHGITDPGPPVTSGSVGGSACAASMCSPAWVSLPVAQVNPAQPTPARAPNARALPTVRWSFAVPPNTRAAPRAAAELSADSADGQAHQRQRDDRTHRRGLRHRHLPGDVFFGHAAPLRGRPGVAVTGTRRRVRNAPGRQRRPHAGQSTAAADHGQFQQVRADPGGSHWPTSRSRPTAATISASIHPVADAAPPRPPTPTMRPPRRRRSH